MQTFELTVDYTTNTAWDEPYHSIGDDTSGCLRVRGEEAHGVARVEDKCLVVLHHREVLHDQQELGPVGEHLAITTICHQLVGELRGYIIITSSPYSEITSSLHHHLTQRLHHSIKCRDHMTFTVYDIHVEVNESWIHAIDMYLGDSGVKVVHDHVHYGSCLSAPGWVVIQRVGPVHITQKGK